MHQEFEKQYILCAAIHIDDQQKYPHQPKNISSGIVVCGRRHCNCFTTITKMYLPEDFIAFKQQEKVVSGFLTSDDLFLTRLQALDVAFESGQVGKHLLGSILTSEDLW